MARHTARALTKVQSAHTKQGCIRSTALLRFQISLMGSMDQSQDVTAAVCRLCGQCGPGSHEHDHQTDASPAPQTGTDEVSQRPENMKDQHSSSAHLLMHSDSRLGRLFEGRAEGKQLRQRVLLRQFVEHWRAAAKEEHGVIIFVVRPPCCSSCHCSRCIASAAHEPGVQLDVAAQRACAYQLQRHKRLRNRGGSIL
jgi:hypothetical protein